MHPSPGGPLEPDAASPRDRSEARSATAPDAAAAAVADPPVSPPAPAAATPPWMLVALWLLILASGALRSWDASQKLDSTGYFDERFPLRNVTQLLRRGNPRPQNAFYPALSYLPQTAVLAAGQGLHRLTGIPALAVLGPRGYTATGYLLCRLVNVLFGLLSLWVVFLIGRRLFDPAVGLLAAALLSAFPRHVLSSVQFKPDILVVLLTAIAFGWALDAAWRPTRGRYLKAGLGVGLTASAKYNGAGVAIGITTAALLAWRDAPERRNQQWRWLVLAGIAAIVSFVALNPFLGMVFAFSRHLLHGYAATGRKQGSDHWTVLWREGVYLVEHHGPVVAVFLGLGLLGLLWHIARPAAAVPPWSEERRRGAIMLIAQLVGYAALLAATMSLFRGQNFLPVVPLSSLVAAWAMVELWRWLVRRLPLLGRPAAAALLWGTVGAALLWSQGELIYLRVVPTTWQATGLELERELPQLALRQVAYEAPGQPRALQLSHGGERGLTLPVDDLRRVPETSRALLDGEVVASARLGDEAAAFANSAVARGGAAREVAASPFRRRGEALTVLLHPWTLAGAQPLELQRGDGAREVTAALPADAVGQVVTLRLHTRGPGGAVATLLPSGRRLAMYETERDGARRQLVTLRLRLAGDEQIVRLQLPGGGRKQPRLELLRWTPPGATPIRSTAPGPATEVNP